MNASPKHLPVHPPFVMMRQVEGLAGPKLELLQFHGALTLLDLFAVQLAPSVFAIAAEDDAGEPDSRIARRVWNIARALIEERAAALADPMDLPQQLGGDR